MKSMQGALSNHFHLSIILLVAFVDYMGIGLVYPLFASLLFDKSVHILSPDTTDVMRGVWLGLLTAVMPIVQFFSAPILGTLSDQKGRKAILLLSLGLGIFSYIIAIVGVSWGSLGMIFLYRVIAGISSGSTAVVQAAVADVSSKEDKAKNFGLFNMALGVGFTIGPFLGGKLSDPSFLNLGSYSLPFWFSLAVVSINFILALVFLGETSLKQDRTEISFISGLQNLKKAIFMKGIRILILCSFIFAFGWSFFFEFAPVLLIAKYNFNSAQIGNFYAYSGALYAIASGLLIRPVIQKLSQRTTLLASLLAAGTCLLLFSKIENSLYLYLYLPFLLFFIALIFPTISAMISNSATRKMQGEMLGILQSAQSVAFGISPLFSGTLVGLYPMLPVILGGVSMIIAGTIFGGYMFRKYLLPFVSLKD